MVVQNVGINFVSILLQFFGGRGESLLFFFFFESILLTVRWKYLLFTPRAFLPEKQHSILISKMQNGTLWNGCACAVFAAHTTRPHHVKTKNSVRAPISFRRAKLCHKTGIDYEWYTTNYPNMVQTNTKPTNTWIFISCWKWKNHWLVRACVRVCVCVNEWARTSHTSNEYATTRVDIGMALSFECATLAM